MVIVYEYTYLSPAGGVFSVRASEQDTVAVSNKTQLLLRRPAGVVKIIVRDPLGSVINR